MGILENYRLVGGTHPETAALRNALACAGVVAPHTDEPYSEALLLGLGGGLGAGYILWEFKEHQARILVFGWRQNWQYPVRFMERVCDRAGAAADVAENGGAKAAAAALDDALAAGKPAIAWVDLAHMPYLQLPEALKGHITHMVVVCGRDGDAYLVDDLAAQPFHVAADDLAAARARIGSTKNRLLLVRPVATQADLPGAVLAGIRDCVDHLSQKSDSFSLPAFRKWARLMTDTKNAKGWPQVFADRKGLYGALRSIYEGIELSGTGGGALRGLYADFLDEAASLTGRPALSAVAEQYRALARRWTTLAESALPDDVEPLAETRRLLRQKHDRRMASGEAALDETQRLTERLRELHALYRADPPLTEAEVKALFAHLGEQLLAIFEAETETLAALRQATV